LGDVLLTTPLIRTIKKNYPQIKIDFLIKPQYADVLRYNPYINNLIIYSENESLITDLKQNKYDLIVDLQNNLRSAKIKFGLKIPRGVFNKRTLDKFLLVNFKINRLKNSYSIPKRYAEAVSEINLDDEGLDLFLPEDINSVIEKNNMNIGFAPGSRHFTKMWPEEYYIQLGNKLADAGYKIFLFGGKSDREICRKITDKISGAADLSNDDNLYQTAIDMKNCAAVVCNDSGLMHTACAVKVPVMVFLGSTVKEFGFAPYKNPNSVLENKLLSCRPCTHIGRERCPLGHFKCMLELTPQTAFDNLLILLKS